jgi:hypothetical protein
MAQAADPRNRKLDGGAGVSAFAAFARGGPYMGTWGELKDSIARLSAANPKDVQQIAASQLDLLSAYYGAALAQSRRSFSWALIGSGIGLAFFVTAVALVLRNGIAAGSVVPLVSGAIVNVVSSIGFYLYGKSSSQLSAFHSSLDAQQRYLLANSICESLEGEVRNTARAALIQEISRGRR